MDVDERDPARSEPDDRELLRMARRNLGRRLMVTLPIYLVLFAGLQILMERGRHATATRHPPAWVPVVLVAVALALLVGVLVWIFTRALQPGSGRVAMLAQGKRTRAVTADLRSGRAVAERDREFAAYVVDSVRTLLWLVVFAGVGVAVGLMLAARSEGWLRVVWFGLVALLIATGVYSWWLRQRVLANASKQQIHASGHASEGSD